MKLISDRNILAYSAAGFLELPDHGPAFGAEVGYVLAGVDAAAEQPEKARQEQQSVQNCGASDVGVSIRHS